MERSKKWFAVITLFVMCFCCFGCKARKIEDQKLSDIEFTVLKECDIPAELLGQIETKKGKEFKCTFYNQDQKDYLYIVVGYGQQPTGGYSITVEDLYLTENSVYIDTSLIGPSKDDVVTQAVTYPYIVVRIQYIDRPVTFI